MTRRVVIGTIVAAVLLALAIGLRHACHHMLPPLGQDLHENGER